MPFVVSLNRVFVSYFLFSLIPQLIYLIANLPFMGYFSYRVNVRGSIQLETTINDFHQVKNPTFLNLYVRNRALVESSLYVDKILKPAQNL